MGRLGASRDTKAFWSSEKYNNFIDTPLLGLFSDSEYNLKK